VVSRLAQDDHLGPNISHVYESGRAADRKQRNGKNYGDDVPSLYSPEDFLPT
jgi:hypothetical protein